MNTEQNVVESISNIDKEQLVDIESLLKDKQIAYTVVYDGDKRTILLKKIDNSDCSSCTCELEKERKENNIEENIKVENANSQEQSVSTVTESSNSKSTIENQETHRNIQKKALSYYSQEYQLYRSFVFNTIRMDLGLSGNLTTTISDKERDDKGYTTLEIVINNLTNGAIIKAGRTVPNSDVSLLKDYFLQSVREIANLNILSANSKKDIEAIINISTPQIEDWIKSIKESIS